MALISVVTVSVPPFTAFYWPLHYQHKTTNKQIQELDKEVFVSLKTKSGLYVYLNIICNVSLGFIGPHQGHAEENIFSFVIVLQIQTQSIN